jgi:curved DNA-binding protein CbpA
MSDPGSSSGSGAGTGAAGTAAQTSAMMSEMSGALTAYAGVPSGTLSGSADASDVDFNDVFSLRRPQNVMSGLSSGLQSTGKGVLAGTAALFAAPYLGAKTEGASGFAKGLAAGIASAVVLPVVGATVGVTQIVRGAMNTPEAIHEANAGKRWDANTREWVADDLVAESVKLAETTDEAIIEAARERARRNGRAAGMEDVINDAANGASGENDGTDRTTHVASTEYYDLLGLDPSCSESEIKRAYYLAARRLHPDKNPDDPEASAKFQKVGEAYQVLSDSALRKKYDARGKDGVGEHLFVDASAFFAAIFGSDQMEGLVGRLQLATMATAGAELRRDETRLLQERRVGRLAIKLAAILDGFDPSDPAAFEARSRSLRDALASASYGVPMLKLIGFVYEKQAFEFANDPVGGLGTWADLGMRSTAARLEQMRGRVNSQVSAAQAGWRAFQAFRMGEAEAAAEEKGGEDPKTRDEKGKNEEEENERDAAAEKNDGPSRDSSSSSSARADAARAKRQQEAMPHVVEALWNASALDIERTIRSTCFKVLHDFSVDQKKRASRAEALARLGKIFQTAELNENDTRKDPMAGLEEAMRKAFERNGEGEGSGDSDGE